MKKILKGLDRELHEKFKAYGSNALLWKRKCVLMLVEIDDARIWEKKGFSCIQEYAGRIAGIGRNVVSDGLRILRKTANMPNIRAVIETRGINIIKPIEVLLTIENEKFWAEKIATMSKNTLEVYVREYRKAYDSNLLPRKGFVPDLEHQQAISIFKNGGSNFPLVHENLGEKINAHADLANAENSAQQTPPKKLVPMQLDEQILQKLEKLKGKSDWNELFTQLIKERDEQLEKEKPAAVKTENRYIPAAIVHYLIKKTNGTCAFKDCTKPYDVIHHTDRFSLSKKHDPDNMEILCDAHHQIVHQSLVANEECGAQNWKITTTADTASPKYAVDQLVQKHRSRANSGSMPAAMAG